MTTIHLPTTPKSSLTDEDFKRIARGSNVNDIWRAIADAAVAADRAGQQDYLDTLDAIFKRAGYTEEYALQWPNEKASITFLRFLQERGFIAAQQKRPKYLEPDQENIIDRVADLDVIAAQQKGDE